MRSLRVRPGTARTSATRAGRHAIPERMGLRTKTPTGARRTSPRTLITAAVAATSVQNYPMRSAVATRASAHSCQSGYGDCNGIIADGCEVSLLDNVDHCNRCGVQCPVLQGAESSCRDGLCYGLCRDGQANCDGIMDNGCEADLENSVQHCGRCGAPCRLEHAESTCVRGHCEFAYCQSNYGNCDGDPTNGCETDLFHSRAHCGACGHRCASVCRSGTCESF
jgi:hypothetical protein